MRTRRRTRLFRDDVLAPWLTLFVVLGLWWLGAQALSPDTPVTGVPIVADDAPARSAGETASLAAREEATALADRAVLAPAEAREEPIVVGGGDVDALIAKRLTIPVAGIEASALRSTFDQARGGGRVHEAMDILAPRGTPVLAAVEGRVAKLFTSIAGGLTIYQFDPEEQFCYYYAHLDGYAPNLTEGQTVMQGQIIGTVGTTGNAPPDTPHLHFAIFKLSADKTWWDGVPLDPFDVLR